MPASERQDSGETAAPERPPETALQQAQDDLRNELWHGAFMNGARAAQCADALHSLQRQHRAATDAELVTLRTANLALQSKYHDLEAENTALRTSLGRKGRPHTATALSLQAVGQALQDEGIPPRQVGRILQRVLQSSGLSAAAARQARRRARKKIP